MFGNELGININLGWHWKQEAHGPLRSAWEPTWPLAKVSDPIFKITIFGHDTWPSYTLFLPPGGGAKLSLFSLYGQRFPRYGAILKISIFGHETWPLAKVPEVAHILPKLPPESQISLRFALRLAISRILAILHFPIDHNVKFQSFKKK